MENYYVPHYRIEIFLMDGWHPIAWFVVLEDATLLHTWLSKQYPKERYRINPE